MNDALRILMAADFAARKHRDQRRKGEEASPYINHPIEVARVIAAAGVGDSEVLAAALLHDTLEDTETTYAEIQHTFGARVANLVAEVSDDKSLPKITRKALQIQHAPELSDAAALVKLADKAVNVTDIVEHPPSGWSLGRRREYLDWAERVVEGLPRVSPQLLALFEERLQAARERLLALSAVESKHSGGA